MAHFQSNQTLQKWLKTTLAKTDVAIEIAGRTAAEQFENSIADKRGWVRENPEGKLTKQSDLSVYEIRIAYQKHRQTIAWIVSVDASNGEVIGISSAKKTGQQKSYEVGTWAPWLGTVASLAGAALYLYLAYTNYPNLFQSNAIGAILLASCCAFYLLGMLWSILMLNHPKGMGVMLLIWFILSIPLSMPSIVFYAPVVISIVYLLISLHALTRRRNA